MPDAARVAQAVPLEVPIVLRGAKISAETGKPELFTETARTVLVFENGVVLNIHSRLTVGQTVFVHNTQNGREVMCKVLEAPAESEPGFTDLEFTTVQEDFWGANLGAVQSAAEAETSAPAAASAESDERAKMLEPSGTPADDPLAMMLETANNIDVPSMTSPAKESGMPLKEELMSAHEMAPDPAAATVHVSDFEPASTSDSPASEPTGEQIDAALKQMTSAGKPLTGADDESSSDEKHIAALMARDARLAKFAAFKERQQAEKSQRAAEPQDAAAVTAPASAPASKKSAERKPEAAEPTDHEVKTIGSKPSVGDLLTSPKYSKFVMIGACALVALALWFIWRAMHVPSIQDNFQFASTTPANPAPGAQPSGAAAAAADSIGSNSAQPGASALRSSRSEAGETRPSRNRDENSAESEAAERRHRFTDAHGDPITPAQVISQPQPTLPPWAVGVGVDGVITLDAIVDEHGNVTDVKVLSGPRQLQREAERAIGLWEFAPARADGKPVPSHLTLSVQFLPPPPPKRVY